MDAAQVLLSLSLLASFQPWSCVRWEDGKVWRWLYILFSVQLDHLMGDTWDRCRVILKSSQR